MSEPSLPVGGGKGLSATVAGSAAFAAFYLIFAWQPGVLRSDDFGYLRSILGTLERGHPYTYEWLAPYGATFSSICALLYRATGNFYASTYGVQAFCSLLVFTLLQRLLARRVAPWHAALLAAAFACGPICFAKAGDFHGGISTLALTLAAMLAFGSGNAWGFFLAVFLAFANRQSHIALLLMPAWVAASDLWIRSGRVPVPAGHDNAARAFSGPKSAAFAIAFIAAAFALHSRMNLTYAMANAVFTDSGHGRLASMTLAGLAGLLVTIFLLALSGAVFLPPLDTLRANLRRPAIPLAASAVLLALRLVWPPGLILTDTPMFGWFGWGDVNATLPWILLAGIWFADFRLLRPSPCLAAIVGFIGIASLRGVWWDYYFLEIAVLCMVIAVGGAGSSHPVKPIRLERSVLVALLLLLVAETGYAYLLRIQMDKQKIAVQSLEKLERRGSARVDRMTGSTFGYAGWKLFDYFLAHDGKTYGQLADFTGYVRKDLIKVETGLPWRRAFKAPLSPEAELLDSGTCIVGFARVPYRVADWHGPDSSLPAMGRPMRLEAATFRSPRFPLNNREWDEWIASPAGR